MAWSFRSSYRLGGYSLESAEDMSRLMLIRLGEGASGGLDWLPLGERSWPLQAVTMTGNCQLLHAITKHSYILIKMDRPMAGTAVLKIRSIVVIPSIIATLV